MSHTNLKCRCSDSRRDAVKIGWSREVKERARQTGGDEREAGRQRRVGKAGRQAEKSRERGQTASRSSFYKPRAKGGVTIRSDAP